MNTYKVFYTYTVPTEDTPFCLVEGSREVDSESHHNAKKELKDRFEFSNKENFKIVKSKLIRENSDRLLRSDGCIFGAGGSFNFNGKEIIVVADDCNELQCFLNFLTGKDTELNRRTCHNVTVSKSGDNS